MSIKLLPANQLDSLTKFSANPCSCGVLNVFHMGSKLLADVDPWPRISCGSANRFTWGLDELLGQL